MAEGQAEQCPTCKQIGLKLTTCKSTKIKYCSKSACRAAAGVPSCAGGPPKKKNKAEEAELTPAAAAAFARATGAGVAGPAGGGSDADALAAELASIDLLIGQLQARRQRVVQLLRDAAVDEQAAAPPPQPTQAAGDDVEEDEQSDDSYPSDDSVDEDEDLGEWVLVRSKWPRGKKQPPAEWTATEWKRNGDDLWIFSHPRYGDCWSESLVFSRNDDDWAMVMQRRRPVFRAAAARDALRERQGAAGAAGAAEAATCRALACRVVCERKVGWCLHLCGV